MESIISELSKIRDSNINLQICILNLFCAEKHDSAIMEIDKLYLEFQTKKNVFLNFLKIFANVIIEIKEEMRNAYLLKLFNKIRNLIMIHISNEQLFNIFQNDLPVLDLLISNQFIALTDHVIDKIISKGKYHIFYLFDKIEDRIKKNSPDILISIDFDDLVTQKFIYKEFCNKENNILKIIQQDNVDDFKIFISENDERSISINFLELVFPFINRFKDKYISFIELASFYNAINIFILLFDVHFMSNSIWYYAIHGNSEYILDFLIQRLQPDSLPEELIDEIVKTNNPNLIIFLQNNITKLVPVNLDVSFESQNFFFLKSDSLYSYFETKESLKSLALLVLKYECIPYINLLKKLDVFDSLEEEVKLINLSIELGNFVSFNSLLKIFLSKLSTDALGMFLSKACLNGCFEMVKKLLAFQNIDVNYETESTTIKGRTPLFFACSNGYSEIVKLLLNQKDIDINKSDQVGISPLHVACANNKYKVVKLLLDQKDIMINIENRTNQTPLDIALFYRFNEVGKLLVKHRNTDVNHESLYILPPLIGSIKNGLPDILKLLLDRHDTDTTKLFQSYEGKTVTEIAYESFNQEIIEIVKSYINKKPQAVDERTIQLYCGTRTKKQDDTPNIVIHGSYNYHFANYRKDGIRYICHKGCNFHIESSKRCKAEIIVPYDIILSGWESNQKEFHVHDTRIIKIHNHSCVSSEQVAAQLVPVDFTQLKAILENIYKAQDIPPGRGTAYVAFLQKIKEEFPEGHVPKVNESLFRELYNSVVHQNKPANDEPILIRNNEKYEFFKFTYQDESTKSDSEIICFSTKFQQELIQKAKAVGIDCTFNISPPGYTQVMVILARTEKMNIPIAHFLLPDKKQSTYETALFLFQKYSGKRFQAGTTFSIDFELAEINAVRSQLMSPGHFLQLCYFHYSQSMYRYYQKHENTDLNHKIFKVSLMFPFVAHKTVYNAISQLKKFPHSSDFANYFARTYLGKYKIEDWSTFEKPEQSRITNNMVESHNSRLSSVCSKDHPSLRDFKIMLAKLEQQYYERYNNADEQNELVEISHYSESDFSSAFNQLIFDLQEHSKENDKSMFYSTKQISQGDEISSSKAGSFKLLPAEAHEYLLAQLQRFFEVILQGRKFARKDILEETQRELKEKYTVITDIDKIRRWFFNNKSKYIPSK